MKKLSLIVLVMALLLAAVLPALAQSLSPDEIYYDFGRVPVGETRTVRFTVTNVSDKLVYCCQTNDFPPEGYPIFCSGFWPTDPGILQPQESAEIEFTFFSPTIFGGDIILDVVLGAFTDACPNGNDETGGCSFHLTGTLIPAPIPPEQQIADILAFFDAAVEAGALIGSGPGSSAPKRLNALRNMIVAAGDLIKQGKMAEACQQLLDVYNRTDGLEPPPDFVKGEAASILAGMIQDLRTSLNCP